MTMTVYLMSNVQPCDLLDNRAAICVVVWRKLGRGGAGGGGVGATWDVGDSGLDFSEPPTTQFLQGVF